MSTIDLSKLAVILVEPSHPGNVGSVARAMANMGVHDLRLVNSDLHHDPVAITLAPHAGDILKNAKKFDNLSSAISSFHLVLGLSARTRSNVLSMRSLPDIGEYILPFLPQTSIALVFGRERTGLTNFEMSCCNEWVTIPTFGNSSLNLAQAVMVVLYELVCHLPGTKKNRRKLEVPAESKEIEGVKDHLFQVLEQINFLESDNRNHMWESFSVLMGRAKINLRDVKMIRGVLHKMQNALKFAIHKKS